MRVRLASMRLVGLVILAAWTGAGAPVVLTHARRPQPPAQTSPQRVQPSPLKIQQLEQVVEFDKVWRQAAETESFHLKPLTNAAPPCGAEKRAEVLARATPASFTVGLDCRLTLAPTDRITKRIIIRGQSGIGVSLDCQGATIDGTFIHSLESGRDTIQIVSRLVGTEWIPPTDVAISNCRIIGSIRALAGWSEEELRVWSRRADFVERIRAAAPHRIRLTNLRITGIGRTPIYLHHGVSRVRLEDSVLDGQAPSVAIYLDSETTGNMLKNNDIRVTSTSGREEIAVDGSSYNVIVGNRLSTLNTGGIYLYRNCGERGVVRHTGPRGNLILNNAFYYDKYTGSNPAIYIGSREGDEGYCDEDEDASLGSGLNDRSYARYNVVMQNRIHKRALSEMIRIGGDGSNTGNQIATFPEPGYNQTVSSSPPRRSGCFHGRGYKRFFPHGGRIDVYIDDGVRGPEPVCGGERTCNDGEWSGAVKSDCSIQRVTAECHRTNQNAGCTSLARCAIGEKIVGAYGACNLEGTTIGNGQIHGIESVPLNTFSVLHQSDNATDGLCRIGDRGISVGNAPMYNVVDRSIAIIQCRERDKNGGDCKVQAVFYCR